MSRPGAQESIQLRAGSHLCCALPVSRLLFASPQDNAGRISQALVVKPGWEEVEGARGELCWELDLLNSLGWRCLAESRWGMFVLTDQNSGSKLSNFCKQSCRLKKTEFV